VIFTLGLRKVAKAIYREEIYFAVILNASLENWKMVLLRFFLYLREVYYLTPER